MSSDKRNGRRTLLRLGAFTTLSVLALSLLVAEPRGNAQSDETVVVLLNARNPTQTLSKAELSKIFLGQTVFWHGVVPVKVVVRPDSSQAAKTFYQVILGLTPQAFRKHWDEVQLAGRGVAPKPLGTVDETAAAVAASPGSIGFALASEAWKLSVKGVKIVNPR
jgi:ABC-type phosphate transport system substrate-binding protein